MTLFQIKDMAGFPLAMAVPPNDCFGTVIILTLHFYEAGIQLYLVKYGLSAKVLC